MENLFSYGTLQYRKVQIETFGRILNGTNDILIGYKLKELKIKNQDVINTSGKENHPIIYKTGNKSDFIKGVLFNVSKEEIILSDKYETCDYKRINLKFKSGKSGWVYIEK
ncbi:MAG: gamma-glutamylcyclotransferase [Flavobacteriaceae bacterium]|jgi:hypothetical protein|nr:gamma-glutamylcyclotransferase [Pelagibacterales bacterium]MBT4959596.1 gamma-glutamylcyclotransferase [Flavobacteriaceae bacterium]MBT6169997.1 gamma-glutamylcyclotransferase [Flavobacteriaceae bacterium]MBT6448553.1 gamma-glutamylcyclotransferase [Flavobacteriaceae bacterium]MBT7624598.1 gamma-glutamylcyclotransferase [Flavobacteriaceae bacterium]|tara:strand:+ start:646 stop:978 length:333 start_codon:yes stop_codon:yes gene_type:complete